MSDTRLDCSDLDTEIVVAGSGPRLSTAAQIDAATESDRIRDLKAEVARLREEVADRDNALRRALDPPCDEQHCSCVPYLRVEVERLRGLIDQYIEWVGADLDAAIEKGEG
jgi:hypothetical protein